MQRVRVARVPWVAGLLVLLDGRGEAAAPLAPVPWIAPQETPDSGSGGTSGGPLDPLQAAFDVVRYDLRLSVDPATKTIQGSNRIEGTWRSTVSTLLLDLDSRLKVDRVELAPDNKTAAFTHVSGQLRIALNDDFAKPGADFAVTVHYGGAPRVAPRPPWDGGFTWSATESGAPWIATSCQTNGADLWWPCKDHPSDKPESFDLHITVPAGLFCASNGALVAEPDAGAGAKTFHWRVSTPIANYGIALNIAPYELLRENFVSVTGETFPFLFWVLPESVEKAKAVLPDFVAQLHFFEKFFGPYPFRADKYGVVETPHLGMEHQSIIAYGNQFTPDKWGYDWLHHHELSHEWWGNLVTAVDWKDLWIHESFGTYTQTMYTEQLHGLERARQRLAGIRPQLLNRLPIAPREATDAERVYDLDKYYKGAWVLHTLRYLLGDECFFTALRRMCYPDPAAERTKDGSACRFVDTEDFVTLVEQLSGQELSWFFEVYVRQPQLPKLVHEVNDGQLRLRWQTPELPFPMPIDVVLGETTHRVAIPRDGTTLALAGATPIIDPQHWVLRDLD